MIRRVKIGSRKIVHGDRTAYEALAIIFNTMSKIGSSLIALGIFAYIIGWLQAQSYYSVLGATWIVKEFSLFDLLTFSWIPIFPIMVIIYYAVQDLTEKREKKIKEIRFILTKGIWFLISLMILFQITMSFNSLLVSEVISVIIVIGLVFYTAAAFEALISEIQNRNFRWNYYVTGLVYGIVFWGFYWVPTNMGKLSGLRDKNPQMTTLPIVITENSEDGKFRLLFNNENRFYLLKMSESYYPEIYIVDVKDIKKIIHR
jgi:hypothetical protein